jgi:hypothetical protein
MSPEEEHDLPSEPVPKEKFLFQWDAILHRGLDRLWDKIQVNCVQSAARKVHVYERTLSVIALVFSVAALVTALLLIHESDRDRIWTDREISRLVHEVNVRNVLVQDHDAIMLREGLKQPGDIMKGPTGNIEFEPRK